MGTRGKALHETPGDMDAFANWMWRNGYGLNTSRSYRAFVRQILNRADPNDATAVAAAMQEGPSTALAGRKAAWNAYRKHRGEVGAQVASWTTTAAFAAIQKPLYELFMQFPLYPHTMGACTLSLVREMHKGGAFHLPYGSFAYVVGPFPPTVARVVIWGHRGRTDARWDDPLIPIAPGERMALSAADIKRAIEAEQLERGLEVGVERIARAARKDHPLARTVYRGQLRARRSYRPNFAERLGDDDAESVSLITPPDRAAMTGPIGTPEQTLAFFAQIEKIAAMESAFDPPPPPKVPLADESPWNRKPAPPGMSNSPFEVKRMPPFGQQPPSPFEVLRPSYLPPLTPPPAPAPPDAGALSLATAPKTLPSLELPTVPEPEPRDNELSDEANADPELQRWAIEPTHAGDDSADASGGDDAADVDIPDWV